MATTPHVTDTAGANFRGDRIGADFEHRLALAAELLTHGQYDQAIVAYTKAYQCTNDAKEEAEALLQRSCTYTALCAKLRSIPAAESESRALFGHDPFHLADLGLRDAQKALQLRPKCQRAYVQMGRALAQLERYYEAQDAYMQALGADPGYQPAQEALAEVRGLMQGARERTSPNKRARGVGGAGDVGVSEEEYECTLCLKLLYEPATTTCGHSFCKACLMRTLDHTNRCPMCRTVLHLGRDVAVTVALRNIVSKMFPNEYAARAREVAEEAQAAAARLPLFVMSTVLPGEKMALNIFEPRYRLMVRRCMEGGRRFGMAQLRSDERDVDDVACEVEIVECQAQHDGRFYLEVEGRRRVKIDQLTEQDGYRLARAVELVDVGPAPGSPEAAALPELAHSVEALAGEYLDKLRQLVNGGTRLRRAAEFLERAGQRPPADDYEKISFWAARLMVNLPHVAESERMVLMRCTCTHQRLAHVHAVLSRKQHVHPGCCFM